MGNKNSATKAAPITILDQYPQNSIINALLSSSPLPVEDELIFLRMTDPVPADLAVVSPEVNVKAKHGVVFTSTLPRGGCAVDVAVGMIDSKKIETHPHSLLLQKMWMQISPQPPTSFFEATYPHANLQIALLTDLFTMRVLYDGCIASIHAVQLFPFLTIGLRYDAASKGNKVRFGYSSPVFFVDADDARIRPCVGNAPYIDNRNNAINVLRHLSKVGKCGMAHLSLVRHLRSLLPLASAENIIATISYPSTVVRLPTTPLASQPQPTVSCCSCFRPASDVTPVSWTEDLPFSVINFNPIRHASTRKIIASRFVISGVDAWSQPFGSTLPMNGAAVIGGIRLLVLSHLRFLQSMEGIIAASSFQPTESWVKQAVGRYEAFLRDRIAAAATTTKTSSSLRSRLIPMLKDTVVPFEVAWAWHLHLLHPSAYRSSPFALEYPQWVRGRTGLNRDVLPTEPTSSTSHPPPSKKLWESIDWVAIHEKQVAFLKKVRNFPRVCGEADADELAVQFLRFLVLMRKGEDGEKWLRVPTVEIDVVWHAVMHHPPFYSSLCLSNAFQLIDHNDLIGEDETGAGFSHSQHMFENVRKLGRYALYRWSKTDAGDWFPSKIPVNGKFLSDFFCPLDTSNLFNLFFFCF